MTTITLEEAQAQLPSLIANLKPGDEVLITQRDQPVARLIPETPRAWKRRRPGTMVGKLKIIREDEGHLVDFHEYMP